MLNQLKIKLKNPREEPTRRIRTDYADPTPKNLNPNPVRPRMPLAENKKTVNQTDTLVLKKAKTIKGVALKQHSTKLNTEHKDRETLTQAHRVAIDKIFGRNKDTHPEPRPNKAKEGKEGRELSTKDARDLSVKESGRGANRYLMEDKAGSGTFGVVFRARDKRTLELVAIKKVFQDKKYKNRQLQILKSLNHPNVLKIRDSFFTYESDKEYLNVVMDYFPNNLYESLQKYRNKGDISRLKMKVLAYQLFRGLLYLKSLSIAHRDMKPQNVLVNDNTWKLLICDFGSAKKLVPDQPNLAYICSRCYRAPELIFGSTHYDTQIDMWAAGCILAEMVSLQPVFRSDSNLDQLVEIIKVLGTPSHQEMLEMNPDCEIEKYQFPKISARPWQKVLKKKHLGDQFYDLLGQVLTYSPSRRLTPRQALLHPFFDEIRQQAVFQRLQQEYMVPDLFSDEDCEREVGREVEASRLRG